MGRVLKYPRSPIHWKNRKNLQHLDLLAEASEIAIARQAAVHLKPAPTNKELRRQYMSSSALELKRITPMFTPYE
jgi:hypothetical protein